MGYGKNFRGIREKLVRHKKEAPEVQNKASLRGCSGIGESFSQIRYVEKGQEMGIEGQEKIIVEIPP